MSKLFHKSVFYVIYFTLLTLILFSVALYDSFEKNIYVSVRDNISKKVSLSKPQIDLDTFERKDSAELKIYADRIKALTGLRTTLMDKQGRVLADSDVPLESLADVENHISREEVREALIAGTGLALRTSATIDEKLFYYCETLRKEGRIIGFLRMAMFYPELNNRLDFVYRVILRIDLFIFFLVLIISVYYSYQYNRQLKQTRKELMKKHDDKAFSKIPFQKHHELDRLIGSFNIFGKRMQKEVNSSRDETSRLKTIFNSMDEGVAAFDNQGYITWQNQAFLKTIGIEKEQVSEKPFYDWLHFPPIVKDIEQFMSDQQPLKRRQKYYGNVYLEYQVLPLREKSNHSGGFLLILTDVTRIQQLETIRQDFVANVSHEFKTPLASIRGYSETLLSGSVDEPALQSKFLKKIEKQTFLLENLVTDLLTLSRVERREQQKTAKMDPLPVVDEIAEEFKSLAKAKKMDLVYEKSGCDEPLNVDASNEFLRALLANLLHNAVQYNKPGGAVTLSVKCRPESLRIEVGDNGIGIPISEQERIFERFYRTDEARETNAGGTGLGLSIVRNIVENLNGTIGLESEAGKGSLFWFELPNVS